MIQFNKFIISRVNLVKPDLLVQKVNQLHTFQVSLFNRLWVTGASGKQGPPGIAGRPGDKGPQGQQGNAGTPGNPGLP